MTWRREDWMCSTWSGGVYSSYDDLKERIFYYIKKLLGAKDVSLILQDIVKDHTL